jgi:cystathionine gamma-synthase
MSNAAKLAKALVADPHIAAVYHPSVPGFSGHETALKLWGDKPEEMCGMLGVMLNTEDFDKRNAFSKALTMINYAPTLGGLKTTYQQPVISSHSHMPDDERRKIGITPALVRVSVGIEEPEDIINDFINALKAMD